jgi:hypothetical protein
MKVSTLALIDTADRIAPRARNIVTRAMELTYDDIRQVIREAHRDGEDVTLASSDRSCGIILDRLCEVL